MVGRYDSRENQDQYGLTGDDIKRCDLMANDKTSTSANHNILRVRQENALPALTLTTQTKLTGSL